MLTCSINNALVHIYIYMFYILIFVYECLPIYMQISPHICLMLEEARSRPWIP